jgi:hypothetical protein
MQFCSAGKIALKIVKFSLVKKPCHTVLLLLVLRIGLNLYMRVMAHACIVCMYVHVFCVCIHKAFLKIVLNKLFYRSLNEIFTNSESFCYACKMCLT